MNGAYMCLHGWVCVCVFEYGIVCGMCVRSWVDKSAHNYTVDLCTCVSVYECIYGCSCAWERNVHCVSTSSGSVSKCVVSVTWSVVSIAALCHNCKGLQWEGWVTNFGRITGGRRQELRIQLLFGGLYRILAVGACR